MVPVERRAQIDDAGSQISDLKLWDSPSQARCVSPPCGVGERHAAYDLLCRVLNVYSETYVCPVLTSASNLFLSRS